MLKPILIFVLLLSWADLSFSQESSPRKAESKTETTGDEQKQGYVLQEPSAPFRFWYFEKTSPPIVNVYTGKHAGEESHCAEPKNWKEWGSFSWCRTLEWIDAERLIAAFTVILGAATCILGIATWRLWKATDRLVTGTELTAERQLRAYVSVTVAGVTGVEPGKKPMVEFVIRNTGQTPAYRVRYVAMLDLLPHPLADNQGDLVAINPEQHVPSHAIHSREHIVGDAFRDSALSVDEVKRIESGREFRLYLAGQVYYETFGTIRVTKFCLYFGGPDFAQTIAVAKAKKLPGVNIAWEHSPVHNEAT